MNRKLLTLFFAVVTAFTANAQDGDVREVNGGVDFRNVYNMGKKNSYVKWSVELHGGINAVDDLDGKYLEGNKWASCVKNHPVFGVQGEYDFTQLWGIGFDYTWLKNDQKNYDNTVQEFSLFASANVANLFAPYRKLNKFNAYLNFGVGDALASWKNVTDNEDENKKWKDDKIATHPFIYPGVQFEYNLDDMFSVGIGTQARIFFADPELGRCFHPTTNGGNINYIGTASVRYKFGADRNIRNSNIKKQVDYSLDIKDQLTLINRQARRIDSLAHASEAEISNLRAENERLRKELKTQQDSLDKVAKRTLEVERRVVNPSEDESKLIKASLSDLRFETGKAIIKVESYPSLDQLAELIKSHKEWNVMLSGYTDNAGDPEKNLILSRDRAAAVKAYLVNKGVDAGSIQSVGYGDKDPIAPNNTPAGRAKNRRVELELYTRQ